MNDNFLSQEEIDALVGKNSTVEETDMDKELDEVKKDIIGEVGNISMSTAATTLSSILNRQVMITTPRVSCITFEQIVEECSIPKVVTSIKFKEGLRGHNLLMMDLKDATVIADLMMGGDGKGGNGQFTDLELSAVAEAMNQMIGSASTSMATMLGKQIDILPPDVEVWDNQDNIDVERFNGDGMICRISFDLSVEGLIQSEIMQIFTADTVEEISKIMLGDIDRPEELKEEIQEVHEVEKTYEAPNMQQPQEAPPITIPREEPRKVSVQKPAFAELTPKHNDQKTPRNLDLIMDVPLEFSVVLGKSKKTIKEILSFSNGSIVELDKLADEPLEIYVNGKLIAQGEVVVINENFGIRITNILTREERVQNLR